MVVTERGLVWQSVKAEDLLSNSRSISFDDEWKKLSSLVASSTLDGVLKKPPTQSAEEVWTNHFETVISNSENLYQSHSLFSNALFEALRDSLDGFVYPRETNNDNLIVLRSTNMNAGFGIEVPRTKLGFSREYGLSTDSKPDHGCYVFGTNKQQSSITNNTSEFYDMTAVVDLKLESDSCRSFAVDRRNEIKPPNFVSKHGPMGQALLYSMDIWHCLARRGVCVNCIPVLVLAGKSASRDSGKLCCLEAHIQIPEYCGEEFKYSVDRIVSFNGTTGLNTDEAVSAATLASLQKSRDKRALALYIKTMRIGLERAIDVCKNRNLSDPVSPVSLCCHRQLKRETHAQLIASPIPCEDHLRNLRIKINQGELFSLTRPTKEYFSGLGELHWFVDMEHDGAMFTNNCLVKVSCASVHNTYISHGDSKEALYKLHVTSKNNEVLKKSISKVLLGYCYVGQSRSLITIMKDLQLGDENFKILHHQKFCEEGKLPQLWAAFCILVTSLLLPMASENIIHLDIRSNASVTYNILVFENTSDHNYKIDLCLIDFDSVVVSNSISSASITYQDEAVYWEDLKKTVALGAEWKSANRYLLWQVLWIAYTWHPLCVSSTPNPIAKDPNARNFVHFLFDDKNYMNFKNWLGIDRVEVIRKATKAEEITAAKIEEVLNVVKSAF